MSRWRGAEGRRAAWNGGEGLRPRRTGGVRLAGERGLWVSTADGTGRARDSRTGGEVAGAAQAVHRHRTSVFRTNSLLSPNSVLLREGTCTSWTPATIASRHLHCPRVADQGREMRVHQNRDHHLRGG